MIDDQHKKGLPVVALFLCMNELSQPFESLKVVI
jgi:hypothetical protein